MKGESNPNLEIITDRIGPYKLHQLIGEGGMGEVWQAEQTQPVRRIVALKLIKPGMDSKEVLARFEAERQALAMMDHPNIARVLDAGTSASGRPYFVMELIKGLAITDYCDQAKLSVRERLELFIPVCHAVQHAHQKGIIHRDLKPSNVLISQQDGQAVPKVIDFGVAKALHQSLTQRTLVSEFGMMLGTPEYMSPEQAQLDIQDIDTRADTYSLGVILYELLTGATPFDRRQVEYGGVVELLRLIREVEPVRPSKKLTSIVTLAEAAGRRQSDAVKLPRQVRGELDWIVMKCLEKDRNRRYETANSIALDITRYLHDEPVAAGPPSKMYRLRKIVRRNRGAVFAASAITILLITGIISTSVNWLQAVAERNAKEAALIAKDEALRRAEHNQQVAAENERLANEERNRANRERHVAAAVRQFLQNDLLRQASPWEQAAWARRTGAATQNLKYNPPIVELLDRAALELAPEKISQKFPGEPLLQAELLDTIGETYVGVGEGTKAIAHLARACQIRTDTLHKHHPSSIVSRTKLAFAYLSALQYPEAVGEFTEVLRSLDEIRVAEQSSQASGQLRGAGSQFAEAIGPALETIFDRLSPDRPIIPNVSENLMTLSGTVIRDLGLALYYLERLVPAAEQTFGKLDRRSLCAKQILAFAYEVTMRRPKAIEWYQEVISIAESSVKLDEDRLNALRTNLARAYYMANRVPDGIRLYEIIYASQSLRLPPNHPWLLSTIDDLGTYYLMNGQVPKAIDFLQRARAGKEAAFGPDNPTTIFATSDLARAYMQARRYAEAEPLLVRAVDWAEKNATNQPQAIWTHWTLLGVTYRYLGRLQESHKLLDNAVKERRSHHGPKHHETLVVTREFARCLSLMGQYGEALRLLEEVLAIQKAKFGLRDPQTSYTIYQIACLHAFRISTATESTEPTELALNWLRQAVDAGFADVESLKRDMEMDALRQQEEFQKILLKLENARRRK